MSSSLEPERACLPDPSELDTAASACRRCGACCGIRENDPCEHLKKGPDGRYLCDVYEERFGLRKTLSGEPILCVPIRDMLHKTWWGRSECAYVKALT